MKKLLFSLVAAAACGAVTADNVPATATFDSLTAEATFDVGKTEDQTVEIDDQKLGYWAVNMATDPELTVKAKSESDKYLSLNTGSTPLWRTFTGIGIVGNAKAGTLPAGVDADGKVVSSDVKLTACTEWPTLTDFANEKLALFLFVPEEGDTSNMPAGLYAVGGAMVTPEGESTAVLTNKAYKLTVEGNANITNEQGWATISIKTYGDIYKTSGNKKISGFVIAVGGVIATRTETTGFAAEELTAAAATRIGNGTLIPAALATTDATIAGLGFQGEGGIDNVNLFADDFAVDADAMTVVIPEGVDYEGITLGEDDAYSFTSTNEVTFTLKDVAGKIVTVDYGDNSASYNKDSYTVTFTPVKDATLTITVEDAKFMVGGTPYANFAAVLTAIKDGTITGGEIDLLDNASAGEDGLSFDEGEYIIDLNGFTLSAEGNAPAIYNGGAEITINDSSVDGTGKVDGRIENAEGTLVINAGTYEGAILTNEEGEEATYVGTTTINGGKFAEKVEAATIPGDKKWSDLTEDYYTLVNNAGTPPTPTIPEGDQSGTAIEKVGDDYVVTPGTDVTEVTVNTNGFAGVIQIPSTVEKIIGVAKEQLRVVVSVTGDDSVTKTYNITEAIKLAADGTISLDDTKTVTVEVTVDDKIVSEPISVKPELATTAADGITEVAPFEAGATPAATVKTIPGLTYSLDYDSDVKGAFGTSAALKTADGNRMTLQDTSDKTGVTKRFYKIRVRK